MTSSYCTPRFQAHYEEDGTRMGVEILDPWPRLLLIDDSLLDEEQVYINFMTRIYVTACADCNLGKSDRIIS